MTDKSDLDFIYAFKRVQVAVYKTAVEKGFWEDEDNVETFSGVEPWILGLNTSQKLMLVTDEISEAHDALRHGNPPSDHIPEFSGAEEECADAIIRLMDLTERRGWRVAEAIEAKRAYNQSRPYKHGKKF